jgi:hypothetical protein
MGRLLWLAAALGAVGCGKVAPHDVTADAPYPDAFSCPAEQLECSGTCVSPTTNDHCGACDTKCETPGSMCMAEHCVDAIKSCADIKAVNSTAMTGLYSLVDGTPIYCDMTAGKGYTSLIIGQFDSNPTGYTGIAATDLQNAAEQTAFIALFNAQGGLKVITQFTSGNCCFKNDATSTSMLFFQAADVYPELAGASACSPPGGYVTTSKYGFDVLPDTATPVFISFMASNFFTTYPATATVGCTVNTNPALFWEVTQ